MFWWVKCNLDLFFMGFTCVRNMKQLQRILEDRVWNTFDFSVYIMKLQFIRFVLFCKLLLFYCHCHTNNCWQVFSVDTGVLSFLWRDEYWSRNTSVRVLCQLWRVNVWGLWHEVQKHLMVFVNECDPSDCNVWVCEFMMMCDCTV